MKTKVFRMVKAVAFCALLFLCISHAAGIVKRKASDNRLQPFFERAQEIDVLFVGNSHMVNGVFPLELWRDYGIAAYNIGNYGNTLPLSYWMMKNALDFCTPKLMVIDVKDIDRNYKLSGSGGDARMALDGFPLSLTKARAIEDLMDDPYAVDDDGNLYADLKWEFYVPLAKYHARWNELGEGDFVLSPNALGGGESVVAVATPNDYDIIDEWQVAEDTTLGFSYLRMMIDECQSRGIDVLITHLPYPASEQEQENANAVWYIADAYGVNYIDFVNLDQVVDYKTDCFDSFSHLNPSGAKKVTDYLGRYIAEHYGIEDRRGNARYASWDEAYAGYARYKLNLARQQSDLACALMLLHDASLSAVVCVKPGSALYRSERLLRLTHNTAREHIFEEDAYAKWSDALFPLDQLDEAAAQGAPYLLLLDRQAGEITERTGATDETLATSFGALRYRCDEESVSLLLDGEALFPEGAAADVRIVLIDELTAEVAAVLSFNL